MKKFLIVLALFGFAEFALADESNKSTNEHLIFGTKFEFDIDEYVNKPYDEGWSEIEKKVYNVDRNSYMKMTQDDREKCYEAFKPCVENSDQKVCEKYKIIYSRLKKIAIQIFAECADGNADSCYDAGRDMITEIHVRRDDETAKMAFEVGCSISNSAKNCEQLGLMLFYTDKNKADELLTKACEMDKNHCDGIALTTKKADLAKQMCEDGNAFACINYSSLMDKSKTSLKEVNRVVNTMQKYCDSDIDAEFEHFRAMFDSNAKFEHLKNLYKDGCKD